jgi:hypothetical protein
MYPPASTETGYFDDKVGKKDLESTVFCSILFLVLSQDGIGLYHRQ